MTKRMFIDCCGRVPTVFAATAAMAMSIPSGAMAGSIPAEEKEVAIVGNFALLDHEGNFHELDYYCRMPESRGIVLFIQGNGCPLVQKRVPELRRLRDTYQSKGILFAMLNANPQDTRSEIAAEASEFDFGMPVLHDEAQLVAESLGVTRTAEVFLIDTSSKSIIYRGAMDDRMSYQKEKPTASETYLTDALDALVTGNVAALEVRQTEALGCKVAMPRNPEGITYVSDVVPILKKRCAGCHTKGGVAPFAMSSYRKAKGWSEMMVEVLMTKQMPPWHADPEHGKFSNDCGISPEEMRTLVAWVDADCPRGEGDDPLESHQPAAPEWHLGEPMEIVTIPEQEVAAEGVFDYRYVTLENPFEEDVWLTATEVSPGNTRVLHHVIVTAVHPEVSRFEKWVTGYAPGTQGSYYPEESSVHLPKGWKLKFQLHYTASGKDETDATRLGLHFVKEPTPREFRTKIVMHRDFKIPPGATNYRQEKSFTFKRDTTVYSINPHMHYRGKHMSFEAEYPDGKKEVLLSVPNYNFNWQRTYVPVKPLALPAGTRIVVRNGWDNSSLNPHNPNPDRSVGWGDQSFDEMFFATLGYTERK